MARWPGLLALLFYGFGAADYLMVRLEFQPWMRLISPDQAAWIAGQPAWVSLAWAVAVWGGLAGALLWLTDTAGTVLTLALAAVATLALAVHALVLASPPLATVGGAEAVAPMIVVAAVSVLLWLWARALRRRALRHPFGKP